MRKIISMYENLRATTPEKVLDIVLECLEQEEGFIIQLNQSQLQEGVDSKGNFLREYRSESYAKRKLKLNPRGVTDLKLTGAFYGGFFVRVTGFPGMLSSTDSKTEELVKKYGKYIFGLTETNKSILVERIKGKVVTRIKATVFL